MSNKHSRWPITKEKRDEIIQWLRHLAENSEDQEAKSNAINVLKIVDDEEKNRD